MKSKTPLTILAAFVLLGSLFACVPDAAMVKPTKNSGESQQYLADIEPLFSIKKALESNAPSEQIKASVEKLENRDLKNQLLTELKNGNYAAMKSLVAGELQRLLERDVVGIRIESNENSYKDAGRRWGRKFAFWNIGVPPQPLTTNCIDRFDVFVQENIDCLFVHKLATKNKKDQETGGLNYFFIHADLKHAFQEGFRQGYENRTADLVLGPHVQLAGGMIGDYLAKEFVEIITNFENGWAATLRDSVNIYITLISEGSQADREDFINRFMAIYKAKYEKTNELIKKGMMGMISEGGTKIYVNTKEAGSALDIPSNETLKNEIYRLTFWAMGDELGRRFRHNLIKRDDLIDLLRRTKPVFSEAPKLSFNEGIQVMTDGFAQGYESNDAREVFQEMKKVAGLISLLKKRRLRTKISP